MSNLAGTWDLALKTPVGTLAVEYRFKDLRGTATSKAETVPLMNIVTTVADGVERVTWQQRVTKPMRLNLDFEVEIDGDTMTGYARAGRLPHTRVTGLRKSA
ncbi:hypothetical protein ACFVVM_19585 [Nocardia sp. NPDC058176]|uniref:hypothetical protein n=1 Tax=Nocardia sp. NPDC058176 TaxID=3346368 RepID=UPI0036DAD171